MKLQLISTSKVSLFVNKWQECQFSDRAKFFSLFIRHFIFMLRSLWGGHHRIVSGSVGSIVVTWKRIPALSSFCLRRAYSHRYLRLYHWCSISFSHTESA